jgi:hypothetical protein
MAASTRPILISTCLGALLAVSEPALAQGNAAADALFQQGMQEMEAGKYESACQKFRDSDQVDPAVNTKFNLGDCEEKRGNLATAWKLFKAVEAAVPPSDERHAIAKRRREAVETRVPKLRMVLGGEAPKGTTVRCGDVELGSGNFGIALPMDPGEHVLTVRAPGRADQAFSVRLTEGQLTEVTVMPGPALQAGAAPVPAGGSKDGGAPSGGRRTLGFVVGGVGATGLVVGAVTGIMALGKKSTADDHCYSATRTCDQTGIDANDSGRTLGTVSTVGFAVGLVGLGLGTYLVLSSHDSGKAETALTTEVGPTGSRVSVAVRW